MIPRLLLLDRHSQPTGITTTFTFASGYVVGYLDVFLNGAKQIEGQDYDANNGSTFDVSGGGAINGDVLRQLHIKHLTYLM